MQYQLTIEAGSQVYFNFTDDKFQGNTTVYLESIVADTSLNQVPPQMYYWVCDKSKECKVEDFEDAVTATEEANQAC